MILSLIAGFVVAPIHLCPSARVADSSREDKDGWIVLHLAGKPKEVGFQYGTLAAKEIDDAHKALRATIEGMSGKDWPFYRRSGKDAVLGKIGSRISGRASRSSGRSGGERI